MKKVLFTATVDSHILQFHIPYLKWFKEQGYEVHVVTNGDEKIPYCDIKHKISFQRSPIKIDNIKAIFKLKKIIEEEKFDIIHCHTPMGSVVTRLAAKNARKKYKTKVIYTAHGFHFFKGAPLLNWIIFYPIEKYLSKYTDCLITINEEDYNLAKSKFKAKRIELVNGVGVDKSKFDFKMSDKEKHELRKNLGLKDDDFVLIQVGELNKNKNQIMTINAMKTIVEKKENIKLLIVGKGKLKDYYIQKIKEYHLEDNIYILGFRKDIPQLLKLSDCLISTSKREGLPVNLIEAAMSDLPIIATNCRGNRDIARKVVEVDKIKELCDNINICTKSKNLYTCKDIDKYKIENIMKKMGVIYSNEKQNSVSFKK